MTATVALVDYGAGNLHSVANALRAAGAEDVVVTNDPSALRTADRIVLPGVGAFAACARALRAVPHLVEAIEERVQLGGAPFLGICVGMQLLATRGLEHGATDGLDWIAGEVRMSPRRRAARRPT
jgi:glutamine amidotransferase